MCQGLRVGDVVNLNRFRKAKERAEKAKTSAANRAKFGRTQAERDSESKQRDRARVRHEGHELESNDD